MSQKYVDSFGARKTLKVGGESYDIFRLDQLEKAGFKNISRLPVSLKVLLENLLRQEITITCTRRISKRWLSGIRKRSKTERSRSCRHAC